MKQLYIFYPIVYTVSASPCVHWMIWFDLILRSQRLEDFTSPLQRRGVQVASRITRKANANAKYSDFDIAHTRVNNIMIPWFEGLHFSLDNERFHRGGEPHFWHLSLEKAERCTAVKASSVVQICQAIARRRKSIALWRTVVLSYCSLCSALTESYSERCNVAWRLDSRAHRRTERKQRLPKRRAKLKIGALD